MAKYVIQQWERFHPRSSFPKEALLLKSKISEYPVDYKKYPDLAELGYSHGLWEFDSKEEATKVLNRINDCYKKLKMNMITNKIKENGQEVIGIYQSGCFFKDEYHFWYQISEI